MNAHILVAVLIALATQLTGVAHAQTFPSKAVRIVVPFPPGGAADITSRVLAEHMAKGLGQSVLVENRPGGSTIIGAEVVARARPGEISYGTPGTGTTHHVMGEMLKLAAKINIVHAPFQGLAPALTAATGGHIQMVYGNVAEIAPSVKSGRMRAIVVTTAERADVLPDVPTMREAGYPELEATNWSGMVVPSATPPPAIARLNAELVGALRNADIQGKLRSYGMSPAPSTPDQFDAFLKSEAARYAKVVREAGVKAD